MTTTNKGLAALEVALQRLRSAIDSRDEDAVWRDTRDVLGWLYRIEENEKAPDSASYYNHRSQTPIGQTLAGLIWVRGLADHHDAEVRELVLKPLNNPALVNELVPGETYVLRGGELKPIASFVLIARWPARSSLPQRQPDRHRRDLSYDKYVAEQPVLAPLEAARDYFASRCP